MPFPLKVSEGTNLQNKGLSLFTEAQVHACIIERADKIYSIDSDGGNSTFIYWVFKISDELSNEYEWRDFTLSVSASLSDIGDAIVEHVTANIYKLPYYEAIEDEDDILHTVTVGDGDEGVGERVKNAVNA